MTKPENFILTTDYATLKNDADDSATVVIPSNFNIAGSGTYTNSSDLTIGQAGAITRRRFTTSAGSGTSVGTLFALQRSGTNGGSPATYTLVAFFHRTSATNLRCQVLIQNPYGSTLTTATGETITFEVSTFIPPAP